MKKMILVKSIIHIALLYGTFLQINAQQFPENVQFAPRFHNPEIDPPNPNAYTNQRDLGPVNKFGQDPRNIFAHFEIVEEVEVLPPERVKIPFENTVPGYYPQTINNNGQGIENRNYFQKFSLLNPSQDPRENGFQTLDNLQSGPVSDFQKPYYLGSSQKQTGNPYPVLPEKKYTDILQKTQLPNVPNGASIDLTPSASLEVEENPMELFWIIVPQLQTFSSLGDQSSPKMSGTHFNNQQYLPALPQPRNELENNLLTHEERLKIFLDLYGRLNQNLPMAPLEGRTTEGLEDPKNEDISQEKRVDQAIRLLKVFRNLIQMKKDVEGSKVPETKFVQNFENGKQDNTKSGNVGLKPSKRPIDLLVEDHNKQKLENESKFQSRDQNSIPEDRFAKMNQLYQKRQPESDPLQEIRNKNIFEDFLFKTHKLYHQEKLENSGKPNFQNPMNVLPQDPDRWVSKLGAIYDQEKSKIIPFSEKGILLSKNCGHSKDNTIPADLDEKLLVVPILNVEIVPIDPLPEISTNRAPKVLGPPKFDERQKELIKSHLGAPILRMDMFPKNSAGEQEKDGKGKYGRPASRLDILFNREKPNEKSKVEEGLELATKSKIGNLKIFPGKVGDAEMKSEKEDIPFQKVQFLKKPEKVEVTSDGKHQHVVLPEPPQEILQVYKSAGMVLTDKVPPAVINGDIGKPFTFSAEKPTKSPVKSVKSHNHTRQPKGPKIIGGFRPGNIFEELHSQKLDSNTVLSLQKNADNYQKVPPMAESPNSLDTKSTKIEEKITKLTDDYKNRKLEEIYGPIATKVALAAQNGEELKKKSDLVDKSKLVHPNPKSLNLVPVNEMKSEDNVSKFQILDSESENKGAEIDSDYYYKDTSGLALKTTFLEQNSDSFKENEVKSNPRNVELPGTTSKPIETTNANPPAEKKPWESPLVKMNLGAFSMHANGKKETTALGSKNNTSVKESKLASSPEEYENPILGRTIQELSEKKNSSQVSSQRRQAKNGAESTPKGHETSVKTTGVPVKKASNTLGFEVQEKIQGPSSPRNIAEVLSAKDQENVDKLNSEIFRKAIHNQIFKPKEQNEDRKPSSENEDKKSSPKLSTSNPKTDLDLQALFGKVTLDSLPSSKLNHKPTPPENEETEESRDDGSTPEPVVTEINFDKGSKKMKHDFAAQGFKSVPEKTSTTPKNGLDLQSLLGKVTLDFSPSTKISPIPGPLENEETEESGYKDDDSTPKPVLTGINFDRELKKLKYNFGTQDLKPAPEKSTKKNNQGNVEDITIEPIEDEEASGDPGNILTSFPFQLLKNLF